MSLTEARCRFTHGVGYLLQHANALGLAVLLDEAKRHPLVAEWNATHCRVQTNGRRCERTPKQHVHPDDHKFLPIGIRESTHASGLAIDLYIIAGGKISNAREQYAQLGEFWKGLEPVFRWGGDFKGFPDLGHFSHEWKGRK